MHGATLFVCAPHEVEHVSDGVDNFMKGVVDGEIDHIEVVKKRGPDVVAVVRLQLKLFGVEVTLLHPHSTRMRQLRRHLLRRLLVSEVSDCR